MKEKGSQVLKRHLAQEDTLRSDFSKVFCEDGENKSRCAQALLDALLAEYDDSKARHAVAKACSSDSEISEAFNDAFGDSRGIALHRRDWKQRVDALDNVMRRALQFMGARAKIA